MPNDDFSQFADSAERSAELVGFDPTRPAGDRKIRKNLAQILALQFGNDASANGIEAEGETVIDLSTSRLQRYTLTEDVKFTLPNLTTPHVTDRGEFTLVITMRGDLRTVEFSPEFKATKDSEDFDSRFKIYIVRCLIVENFVIYEAKGHLFIAESEFANTLYMVGDLGFDKGLGFVKSMSYLKGKEMEMKYLLYAGDVNYTMGSESTIVKNTAPLDTLIDDKKVLAIHGNHDLDAMVDIDINFMPESWVFPLAGEWHYTNDDVFSSDWITNAATSAGWPTAGGKPNKIPGFGDDDTVHVTKGSGLVYSFTKVVNLGAAPIAGKVARVQMYIDDGARVFINGKEVYHFNLECPIDETTPASSAVGESDTIWDARIPHVILIDATVLQAGDNLIAAEVRQVKLESTDLAWDMSLEIGTSTDAVPAKTEEVRFTNGYGQPLKNKLRYLENGMLCYHREIPGVASIYSLNDGLNTNGIKTNPWMIHDKGRMHQWLSERMAADTNPFKIVQIHRCCVATCDSSSHWNGNLNWPLLQQRGVLLVFGHTHQTNHYEHSSGQHVVNASNSGGRSARPLVPMMGEIAGYTNVWSDDSTEIAVCRIDAGPNFLRCRFERTMDGSIMHEFIMEKP